MGFPRQEYWCGLPFPSPGDLPNPGTQHSSPTWTGASFIHWATREACFLQRLTEIFVIQSPAGAITLRGLIYHMSIVYGEEELSNLCKSIWSVKYDYFIIIRIINFVNHIQFSSVHFSHSVVADPLRPHESQHARPPCLSPTLGVYSNSCPSSRWCHPAISSSVIPFSITLDSQT